MFGVAAGGEDGAQKVLDIYRQELDLAMGQMGWTNVGCAGPSSIVDLAQPTPFRGAERLTVSPRPEQAGDQT